MSDLIRREDVLRLAESGKLLSGSYGERAKDVIKAIPSAEPKVGKWIDGEREGYNGTYCYRYCSECLFERNDDDADKDTPYCPNCGAKMERSER